MCSSVRNAGRRDRGSSEAYSRACRLEVAKEGTSAWKPKDRTPDRLGAGIIG